MNTTAMEMNISSLDYINSIRNQNRVGHPSDHSKTARKETPKKSYECYLCKSPPRTYTQLQNLQSHMKSHTSIKVRNVFKCTKCELKFNQISHLWKHISSMHVDDERIVSHVCDICGKVITHGAIQLHKMIHEGIKPYSCTVCDKSFTTSSNLKQHMWKHSDVQPYKCELCDRSFNRVGRLKDHMRVHLNEKPFQCAICDTSFYNSFSLTTHNKTTHSKEETSILFYDLNTGQVLE